VLSLSLALPHSLCFVDKANTDHFDSRLGPPWRKAMEIPGEENTISFSENGTRDSSIAREKDQDLKRLLDLLDSTDDEDPHNAKAISKDTTWAKLFECIRRHAITSIQLSKVDGGAIA